MRILGVDPGSVSGAWALLDTLTGATVGDLPVLARNVDSGAFLRLLTELAPDTAAIEAVSARPGQGISSAFKFGMAYGTILACISALKIPCQLVTPTSWKRSFGLAGGAKNKEASRALAKRKYPACLGLDRKRDDGRAEALLMAEWAFRREIEAREP